MAPSKKDPKAVTDINEIFAETVRIDAMEKYRIEQFQSMGFTFKQAKDLAKQRHLSSAAVRETFIKKGCTPDIAYRIIVP